MSPLANLLSRGKEDDASVDVSDLPAPALTVIARVNLLPPEIGEAERFRREQVVRGLVVVGAVAVVAVLAVSASGQVSEAQTGVDTAAARATELNAQVAALAEVPATAKELSTVEAQRTAALGSEVRWSQYLNGMGLVTGNLNTQIKTMSVSQGQANASSAITSYTGLPGIATVNYTGISKTQKDFSYFLDALAKQKANVDPQFSSATTAVDTESGKEVISFTSSVTVTDAAESGRYSNSGD